MSSFSNLITAFMLVFATPSLALTAWYHASGPGGQYEGGVDGDEFHITYGCGLDASVVFSAKGAFVAAGDAKVSVDGSEIYSGAATYDSSFNRTTIEIVVQNDYGNEQVAQFNHILNSLSKGHEVSWTYPNGTTFSMTLENASAITFCKI